MRRALDLLYKGSGFLAGFFLVAIAVLSAAQIAARELGFAAYSYDDFAGFCLAATSFLGLAYTFRENEHIRMTLLLHRTRGGPRHALELVSLTAAAFLVGYFTWYACDMTITSYRLNDVSQGLVAVPLWIPQSGMALGLLILFVATTDDLVAALRGRSTSYETARARKSEATAGFER
ncbi:MAG TPA: TRAP transporter small permease [Burkholderiales bacterium]